MNSGDRRYWLFNAMYDEARPAKWKKMLQHGVAAAHYPPGWANEQRNVNALRQIRCGDMVLAALGNYRFAGYGTITSDFSRGGPSLEVEIPGEGGTLSYAERFTCDWTALRADSPFPFVDCSDIKERYSIGLLRGCCVKEIDENTFNALKVRLDRQGAVRQTPREMPSKVPREEDQQGTAQKFIDGFRGLAHGMQGLLTQAEAAERQSAPWYNVFALLRADTDEDKTHTPFLADLLNPKGSHGQGATFLEAFVARCRTKLGFIPPPGEIPGSSWVVQTQRYTSFGVIDLVVIAPALGYIIAIENKVLAGEQQNQLERYSQWLQTQRDCYPHQNLVFLTPEGRRATSTQHARYIRLSYGTDIAAILNAALPGIAADRVRAVVEQYIDTVRQIGAVNSEGVPDMTTDADAAIIEFLLQKENLRMARLISEKLPLALERVFAEFWNGVLNRLDTRLRDAGAAIAWKAELVRDDYGRTLGVVIFNHRLGARGELLEFRVNDTEDGQGVAQGIMVPQTKGGKLDHGIGDLRDRLIARGYQRGAPGCLAAKQTIGYSTPDDYELAVTDRTEEVTEIVSRTFWDLFEAAKKDVEGVNGRLREGT